MRSGQSLEEHDRLAEFRDGQPAASGPFGIGAPGAVALGVVTAVGGGVVRDVLVQRAPLVLHRDIYALAAAVGGVIAVGGDRMDPRPSLVAIVAVAATWVLRMTAYHLKWNAPFPRSAG